MCGTSACISAYGYYGELPLLARCSGCFVLRDGCMPTTACEWKQEQNEWEGSS